MNIKLLPEEEVDPHFLPPHSQIFLSEEDIEAVILTEGFEKLCQTKRGKIRIRKIHLPVDELQEPFR